MTLPKGKGTEPARGVHDPALACKNPSVSNPDRLSGLDTSFLDRERDVAYAAACAVFEGPPPQYVDLLEAVVSRPHLQ